MTQTTEPHGFKVGDPVESTTLELGTIKGTIIELIRNKAVVIEDENGKNWGATVDTLKLLPDYEEESGVAVECPICGSNSFTEPDFTHFDTEVIERELICEHGHRYGVRYEAVHVWSREDEPKTDLEAEWKPEIVRDCERCGTPFKSAKPETSCFRCRMWADVPRTDEKPEPEDEENEDQTKATECLDCGAGHDTGHSVGEICGNCKRGTLTRKPEQGGN